MSLADLDDETRARADRRLRREQLIWLTTVRADGQPQTSPVGFLWDGTAFLILSQPAAPKVRNLRGNPRVALHLDTETDAPDGGVLTLEGVAELDGGPLSEGERSAYLARYLDDIRAQGMTPDEVFAEYSSVIRVTPQRVRSY